MSASNNNIAYLRQQCHNSKFVIFQDNLLKVLKCSMMFLSIPITQKCQILTCDTLVANERYVHVLHSNKRSEQLKMLAIQNKR